MQTSTWPWAGWVRRGESSIAPAGLALVLTAVAAMVAAGFWSVRSQARSLDEARVMEIQAAGDLLADAVEVLAAADELSALRRLVISSTRRHQLDLCRVVMPEGAVLADADPARISQMSLPATWADGPGGAAGIDRVGRQVTLRYPLVVPGRGGLSMQISAGPRAVEAAWATEAGIGAIGVGTLVVLLLVYRQLLGRVRPLAAIGESLGAAAGGEVSAAAMAISPRFGPVAEVWNRLMAEREGRWEQQVQQSAGAALAARRSPSGDLAEACHALSQGLVLVDERQQVVYANGAAAVFLGRRREEMKGGLWSACGTDPLVAEAVAAATGASRQRRTVEVEREDDGVLRFSVRPVSRGPHPAAVVVIEDITQQRVAERSRHAFLAQATHELRTPLTNIRLYVETALESGEEDAKLRGECMNVINSESRRLESLVADMLCISEIEAGAIALVQGDVRLDAMFEQLEQDFRATATEKSIAMTFAMPPKLPVIRADRDRLMVALQNLVGNALKYTPAGGKVELTAEVSEHLLSVEVRDTGFGIAEADQARLFERFYRAEDRRVRQITGSGLGLAMAQQIVRLHGGDITVQSQVDQGSTFTLTLPISAEAV